jgi:hypothetical protein
MLSDRLLRYFFRRLYRQRLGEMVAPNYPVILDFPPICTPRYGYGKPPHPQLFDILDAQRNEYAARLTRFCSLSEYLMKIPDEAAPDAWEPCWGPQRYFSSLDGVALYGMLCEFQPERYVETGSGYSTKFARRAIEDHSLSTRITSIDPAPRAAVDALCDTVLRQPLEQVDVTIFDHLQAGDFLFVDGSHRVFQNSDVAVIFMDVLPRLQPGVIVHFHDIFLPYDYLPEWKDRFYSEQYLLGSYLLAAKPKVLLPNAFIIRDEALTGVCRPLIEEVSGIQRPSDPDSSPYGISGGSFWLEIASQTGHLVRDISLKL